MKDETKTEHVTVRLKPRVKALAERLSREDNRSLANLIETLILDEVVRRLHEPKGKRA